MEKANPMRFAIVGLGRIGGSIALKALEKGMEVVVYDPKPPEVSMAQAGVEYLSTLENLREALPSPRIVFLYVPAGETVDQILDELTRTLEPGDVIVDGGNSYWGDSLRRFRRLKEEHRLQFVDCGTSGGVRGARYGACFMAGGTAEAFRIIEPVLSALAVEGGVVHCGSPGSGHFVKLVHNGIEFGMLQAIGEGLELLTAHPEPLPIADILRTWNHGSVIRSWLIELMEEQYRLHGGFSDVPSQVEDTGEVNWLVEDAMRMDVPIPIIAGSIMQLIASRDDSRDWARAVGLMRHGFGDHPLGRDDALKAFRAKSRLGPYPYP